MKWIYSPDRLAEADAGLVGGKGLALLRLYAAGLPVPKPVCIGTAAYDTFVDHHRLRERIGLELYRKNLRDMRWEEIWDASLRVQNLFIRAAVPGPVRASILAAVAAEYGDGPLVIRSSAPEEDAAAGSFAGLHESYVNVSGAEEIIRKIKKVWASLWSNRAVLYRQELGLEVTGSSMAVVLQPFIAGEASGVMFTASPTERGLMVVEAVHGLNQGLVDGAVEPDQWLLDRATGSVVRHREPAGRGGCFESAPHGGIRRRERIGPQTGDVPLNARQLDAVVGLGRAVEDYFEAPQDIEWTLAGGREYLLQARPITAAEGTGAADKRAWYLSLNRSYDNLLILWERITNHLLPEMDRDGAALAAMRLSDLSDHELAVELSRRIALNEQWTSTYWSDFIPFAHGVRLFGEIYNEIMEPEDPFEFVALLAGQQMLSVERNSLFAECARLASGRGDLREKLERGALDEIGDPRLLAMIARLKSHFSADFAGSGDPAVVDAIIGNMINQYSLAERDGPPAAAGDRERLESVFLDKADGALPFDGHRLLELAKASYRLRDDDNIHLGRIGQELERAAEHARRRLRAGGVEISAGASAATLAQLLEGGDPDPAADPVPGPVGVVAGQRRSRARQLQGQPASRGVAVGPARVITEPKDLTAFGKGEVMVIDSIDPTMTFFAPLAAAIVERRGGMLIHGAIIAREYGIPCVTGVVGATELIETGDLVTVDGFLGICTIKPPPTG